MEKIKILEAKDESRWDAFVMDNQTSTFFHLIGWKRVVEKTYGHKPIYLFTEENGRIKGILPLFLINTFLFGKQLVSIPYSPYGGCAGDNKNTDDTLLLKANQLAQELNVKFTEFRNMRNQGYLPTNDNYVTMLLKLDQGETKVGRILEKG